MRLTFNVRIYFHKSNILIDIYIYIESRWIIVRSNVGQYKFINFNQILNKGKNVPMRKKNSWYILSIFNCISLQILRLQFHINIKKDNGNRKFKMVLKMKNLFQLNNLWHEFFIRVYKKYWEARISISHDRQIRLIIIRYFLFFCKIRQVIIIIFRIMTS